MEHKSYTGIFAVAVIQWLVGFGLLSLGSRAAYHVAQPAFCGAAAGFMAALALVWFLLAIGAFVVGWALFSLRPNARLTTARFSWLMIVVFVLALLTGNPFGLLGIAIYAAILYYLSTPEVVTIFHTEGRRRVAVRFGDQLPHYIARADIVKRPRAMRFRHDIAARLQRVGEEIATLQRDRREIDRRLEALKSELSVLTRVPEHTAEED